MTDPPLNERFWLTVAQAAEYAGMGRRVQTELTSLGVPYVPLVHPAARGKIRAKSVYQAHVITALGRADLLEAA